MVRYIHSPCCLFWALIVASVTHFPLPLFQLLMVRTHSVSTVFVQATHSWNSHLCHHHSGYSWLEHSHSPLSLFRLLMVGTVIYAVLFVEATNGYSTVIYSPLSLFRLLILWTPLLSSLLRLLMVRSRLFILHHHPLRPFSVSAIKCRDSQLSRTKLNSVCHFI